jgi:solute carrier family 25, member 38
MQVNPADAQKLLGDGVVAGKGKKYLSFYEATLLIKQTEGYKGYLRGFTPAVIKNFSTAGTYFSFLFYTEELLQKTRMFNDSQTQTLSSAIARTIQAFVSNPIIVIKQRFEVVGFNEYTGIADAFVKIYRQEGIRGYYQGLWISLIRDVPHSAIFYPVYHLFRRFYTNLLYLNSPTNVKSDTRQNVVVTSLASASANAISCLVTNPIDIIRTRVYFQYYSADKEQQYSGLYDGIRKIYEKDGPRGFFRGLVPRVLRKGMATVICWVAYEYLIDKEDAIMAK